MVVHWGFPHMRVFPKWMVYNGNPFKLFGLGVPLIFGNVQMVFMGSPCLPWWGLGVHPHSDPWGFAFGGDYCPDRARKAGSPISGCWTYALDGIQGDADFIAAIFSLNRPMVINNVFVRWHFLYSLQIIPQKLVYPSNIVWNMNGFERLETKQGSYRHNQCCYHCSALSVFPEDGPDLTHLLYTNWGRDAEYRREFLA